MKTIGFFIRHFTERGTEVAVYDYADHKETILGKKSIIYCFTSQKQQQVRFPPSKACYQKFQNRFEIKEINDFNEITGIDIFYTQHTEVLIFIILIIQNGDVLKQLNIVFLIQDIRKQMYILL